MYTSQGLMRGGDQSFDRIDQAAWVAVIGTAPAGLAGQDQVLAVGIWDVVGGPDGFAADNKRFLANMMSWLTSSAT